MVTRNYQAPQFNVQDRRQITETKVAAADTSRTGPIISGDDQWMARMFSNLGGGLSRQLDQFADIERANAYLEGQSKAGLIESEEELEGNVMTRDWAKAGYRDTMGKLQLADNEAQLGIDMRTLREKSPEDMQVYLTQRREKMLPALDSMSREARAVAAGQMALQDKAAIKQYTSERFKYIVGQKQQAFSTKWGVSLQGLQTVLPQVETGEVPPDMFRSSMDAVMGDLVAVNLDQSLPPEIRQSMVFDGLKTAQGADLTALYDYASSTAVPDGRGGMAPLVSQLTQEQQLQLSNAHREAMARTKDRRNLARFDQLARLDAQLSGENPTFSGTAQELQGVLGPMVQNGTITGEKYTGLMNKFYDNQAKQYGNSTLATAVTRGDLAAIQASGKTVDQAMDALDLTLRRQGATPEQRLGTYLQVGTSGFPQGFKMAGQVLGPAVRQMVNSKDGTVLPQHAATFRAINAALRSQEGAGYDVSRTQLLSGVPEEDRNAIDRIMREVDGGAGLDEAVKTVQAQIVKDANTSPALRAAQSQGTAKEVNTWLQNQEPLGVLERGWLGLKSVFSADARNQLATRVESNMGARDGWMGDNASVMFYSQRRNDALAQEASDIMNRNPSATAASVQSTALANLAARTIQTDNGPLFLPKNTNIQSVFGVAPGNQAAIGKAITGMLGNTQPNTRWQLQFAQGRLYAQEFTPDGQRLGTGHFVDPASIRTRIQEDLGAETKRAAEVYGPGKRVNHDGLDLQYSGSNTAGVEPEWMMGFRNNLVEHEGVRAKAYQDLSGKKGKDGKPIMTVGVGVSSHNPHFPVLGPDGTASSAQVSDSFNAASNQAAQKGAKLAQQLGVYNAAGFQLMSELAYQSGTGFLEQDNGTGKAYQAFAQALRSGDVTMAQEAFKGTAAWRFSGAKGTDATKRQKSYLRLIQQTMKG